MPELSGLDLLDMLQDEIPADTFLPVMVLTGDTDPDIRFQAFVFGARDFIRKPVDQAELLLRVRVRLETRFAFLDLHRKVEKLQEALADCRSAAAQVRA